MPMITAQVSPEDMQACTARFRDVAAAVAGAADPSGGARARRGRRYPLMAPPGVASHAGAPIAAWPGMAVHVAEFAVGETESARFFTGRVEHIMVFEGEFNMAFGPLQDAHLLLGRFDLVSVPPNVLRSIYNTGATPGRLVVVTQFDPHAEDRMLPSAEGGGIAITQADIEARVSRAASRVPYQRSLEAKDGVPAEVMKYMAASRVYPIVAPAGLKGRNQNAPLKGLPGGSVSIAECDAGDGPQPHAHIDTREIFLCVEGRFDIVWGDRNEHRLTLEPLDMVAVPPTVMRAFKNVTDQVGRLMVIIHGPEDMTDAISSFPEVAADVEARFGAEAVEAIRRVVKQSFDAVPGSRVG